MSTKNSRTQSKVKILVTITGPTHAAITRVKKDRGLLSDQDVVRLAIAQLLKSAGYDLQLL